MWDPSSGNLETKNIFFRYCLLKVVCATQCVSCQKQEQLLAVRPLHQFYLIIFHDGVYWRKKQLGPSSGKLETKNTSFFVLASCGSCVLPNLLVALSRYKLALYLLRDGCVCTYFLPLH